MMHWSAAYLGRPWQVGATGPAAYDCWGLVAAVLRQRAGVVVTPIASPPEELRALIGYFRDHPEFAHWRPVETPRELDCAVMAQARHPFHVGLWLDGGRILHAMQPAVRIHDRVGLAHAGFRIHGIYRHEALS